jgi:MFS superfamily sulfate permease-like transporter
MEVWMVFMAILPAIMLLILFFFDHNVSSIMAQDPKFNLQKPSAYNLDFAVLGVSVVLCGVFGVPPGNGLIPQAPLHVRALAVVEYEDTPGGKREVYTAVVEKRWSNLLQSVLVLITAFLFPVLKLIPQAVLSGKD